MDSLCRACGCTYLVCLLLTHTTLQQRGQMKAGTGYAKGTKLFPSELSGARNLHPPHRWLAFPARSSQLIRLHFKAVDFFGSRSAALIRQLAKKQWKLIFNRILNIKCWNLIAHQEVYCSLILTWMLGHSKPSLFSGKCPSPGVSRTTQVWGRVFCINDYPMLCHCALSNRRQLAVAML